MSKLFSPLSIGPYQLRNRIIMTPMTRSRADDATGVPTDLVPTYYAQRASAGLIISEGTAPSARGKGYVRMPSIHSDEQVAAWKAVTDEVHAKGGLIFMQIMHSGRVSHPSMQPNGALPVAPSAIQPAGQTYTSTGPQDFVTPRALTTEEVQAVIEEHRIATRRALEAGFDGVELHGAGGYLSEQFLSSGSNTRTDQYGGSVENRARFIIETLTAMVEEAGPGKVGVKFSPELNFNGVFDANPSESYRYVAESIKSLDLAYLHIVLFGQYEFDYHAMFRSIFTGTYLRGFGLTQDAAEQLLDDGQMDAAVFGNLFVTNPDLPERFLAKAPLTPPDRNVFYSEGATGYIDYPALTA